LVRPSKVVGVEGTSAEIEAGWTNRIGKTKMRQLRELLEGLNAAP